VEGGWRWRFDPQLWDKMEHEGREDQEVELAAVGCPIAFVWGERSRIMEADTVAYTRAHAPAGTPMFAVPEAGHHVMLDQPLALVSALRGLLAGWPG
jgi:pimeloyl-ACP methyl ester carboxylesterase